MKVEEELYILPEDVTIFSVSVLNPEIKKQLSPDSNNDYILSRKGSRTTSFILENDSVFFLNYFRKPITIVDAVMNYGMARDLDPRKTLEQVYPLIQRLKKAGILVAANSIHNSKIEYSFCVSEYIANYKILEQIQVLKDVEVYHVRLTDGSEGALKISRKGSEDLVRNIFKYEPRILKLINGPPAPLLIDINEWEKRPYLLLEWCNGITVNELARKLREPLTNKSAKELVNLAIIILESFLKLHKKGIVHGDIHPMNILVTKDNSIRIVDFGQSCTNQSKPIYPQRRIGLGYYYEPECAEAIINHIIPPKPTKLGEQYALAVLLYYLFTGKHYLNFRLERDIFLQQIINDKMIPFIEQGLQSWPEIESILSRALSKKKSDRFISLQDFILELQKYERSEKFNKYKIHNFVTKKNSLIKSTLEHYNIDSDFFRRERKRTLAPPTCSVNYGYTGIAYFYYRMASIRGDPILLSTSDLWITRALQESNQHNAFYNHELSITENTVGKISLYHSPTGLHCVRALIAYFLGDITNLKKAVNDFIVTSRQSYNNLDMTLGLSSVLLGCSILLETLEESHIELVNQIIIHGNKILDEIWNKIDSYDTIGIEKGLPYLGLAHGWAGILYASLRWYLTSRQSPHPTLGKRLIELYRLAQIDNTVANWPLYKESNKSRTGWCHGSSGYVHLWLLANCMFDDQIYFDMAIKAGEHIWKHSKNTFSSIGQLCCGLAGQSYSFLELYKYTSDIKWLKRAKILGYKSERLAKSSHHLPNSLYKGEIGIALLLADLDNPNEACMPMFGSEKLIRSLN